MKKIGFIILSAFAILSLSCAKQDVDENSKGLGALNIGMRVADATKAAMSEEELLATADVNIYKADFSGLVRSYKYAEMPSPFYLAADSYRVDVEAGEVASENPSLASWEYKSYKGSKAFEIVAGIVTNVEVVASVCNAVTKIAFDPTIAENFNPGYTFTIGLNESASLVYDESKSGSEGYFILKGLDEPSFTWTFSGTLTKDGSEFVKTGIIEELVGGKMYKMNLKYTIKDGDLDFTLMVDYTTDIVDDTIVFEPVATGLSVTPVYEIWATRTTLYADVDPVENAGATVQFAYSAGNDSWVTVDAVSETEGVWKADVAGLVPSTLYTYRLVLNGVQVGDERTLTTSDAPAIPNGGFEHVSLVKDASYYKFYDPNCGIEGCTTKFWASGNGDEENPGSASMNYVITEVDKDVKYEGTQSVRAQSTYAVVKLAAGNLFTGYFAGLDGTKGGKVNFGRPWTSRPTALKIYCKYSTGTMDQIESLPAGVNLTSKDYDRAQIKFAIGNWDFKKYGGTRECPILVNTTDESTFIDFYTDPSTIANGDVIIYNDGYEINRGTKVVTDTNTWIEYIIPLDYRNLTTFPTHIVVSCASSMYGDYFSGSTSSKLWLDAAELIY